MSRKTIAGVLCAAFAAVCLAGCTYTSDIAKEVLDALDAQENTENTITAEPGTPDLMPLALDRPVREETVAMGEEGWTIFVYMCGSDLESEEASASEDLEEMLSVQTGDGLRFVVQTGGAAQWTNPSVDAQRSQRFLIRNGEMTELSSSEQQNMGESQTLLDFLAWGVREYPAKHMGVVLWDHGNGYSGTVYDEVCQDTLTVPELADAFDALFDRMTCPFTFVCFDSCLMATAEVANRLVPHADVMIASENTVSGYGLDYADYGNWLAQHPEATGAELGKVMCDGYAAHCRLEEGMEDYTFSVLDLSRLDNALIAFDKLAQEMAKSTRQGEEFAVAAKNASSAQSFGGMSAIEGFSNEVDMLDMAKHLEELYPQPAQEVQSAVNAAVAYQVTGELAQNANGLSVFYPFCVSDMTDLTRVQETVFSPSYYAYIEQAIYSAQSGSVGETADLSSIFNGRDYFTSGGWQNDAFSDWETSYVTLAEQPYISEDGYYTMTLSPDCLDYVQGVYFSLYEYMDEDQMFYLGYDNLVSMDWETGEVSDLFSGEWPSLPDGQPLMIYLIEETPNYDVYSCPIKLNGEDMNLRIRCRWDDGVLEYTLLGVWAGVDEQSGMSARAAQSLQPGDLICPVYEGYDLDTGESYFIKGAELMVEENFAVELRTLPEGDYDYSFAVQDVFGVSQYTESTTFYVDESGQVYY